MNNNINNDDDDDDVMTTTMATATTIITRPTSECMHIIPTHAFISILNTYTRIHFEERYWTVFCEIEQPKKKQKTSVYKK